jgi:lysophospholipase L1-like esterase
MLATVALPLLLAACGGGDVPAPSAVDPTPGTPAAGGGRDTARIPLTELGTGTYLGFPGGLYPGGANVPPDAHAAAGLDRARRVQPLDPQGRPSAAGKVVLLSIGMSNTTQEFCSAGGAPPCDAWTFVGQAAADPTVDRTRLVLVNGARGGQTPGNWDDPADPNYDRVRDQDLARLGLGERQVQVVWLKEANATPRVSLPSLQADAYALEAGVANVVRALATRYPNLQQVFLSSRIYGGYATTALNPEPYAYEGGFAMKWLVAAQIDQARTGRVVDARAGDLAIASTPWLAWGPYLWAPGAAGRADGLRWMAADFDTDGTHPSTAGERKVAAQLLEFFKSSRFTRCWFLAAAPACS